MVTELGHYMLSEKIIVYHNTRELIKKEDMDSWTHFYLTGMEWHYVWLRCRDMSCLKLDTPETVHVLLNRSNTLQLRSYPRTIQDVELQVAIINHNNVVNNPYVLKLRLNRVPVCP